MSMWCWLRTCSLCQALVPLAQTWHLRGGSSSISSCTRLLRHAARQRLAGEAINYLWQHASCGYRAAQHLRTRKGMVGRAMRHSANPGALDASTGRCTSVACLARASPSRCNGCCRLCHRSSTPRRLASPSTAWRCQTRGMCMPRCSQSAASWAASEVCDVTLVICDRALGMDQHLVKQHL